MEALSLKSTKHINYEVVVPANSTATLRLPSSVEGGKEIHLEAGRHHFRLNVSRSADEVRVTPY